MGIDTRRYINMNLEDPVAIVGFPSVGLVSSITANYCVTQLEMEPIAGMSGSSMPPYCLISDGVAYPPVRFYAKKSRTKSGRDLVVCLSEFSPKPEDCYEVGKSVVEELRDLGCRDVICIEGMGRMSDDDEPVICSNGPGADAMVGASGLQRLDNGMIRGISGVVVYECRNHGMNASTLMCPADATMPDPGAAVALIEPLQKMVKGLKLNAKALTEEAEEIRKRGHDPTDFNGSALYR